MTFYCLLSCLVVNGKSAIISVLSPLYVKFLLSLAAFKNFPLFLAFSRLNMVCLVGGNLFCFYPS